MPVSDRMGALCVYTLDVFMDVIEPDISVFVKPAAIRTGNNFIPRGLEAREQSESLLMCAVGQPLRGVSGNGSLRPSAGPHPRLGALPTK
jgi:hypothetical protein